MRASAAGHIARQAPRGHSPSLPHPREQQSHHLNQNERSYFVLESPARGLAARDDAMAESEKFKNSNQLPAQNYQIRLF